MICRTAVVARNINVKILDACPNWLPVFSCESEPEMS